MAARFPHAVVRRFAHSGAEPRPDRSVGRVRRLRPRHLGRPPRTVPTLLAVPPETRHAPALPAVLAAVDLFTEQGYDATTVAQITKSTFFRYFPDKRELLAAGQETLSRLLAEGIAAEPKGASPLEAIAAGLERASSEAGPMNRELGPRLKAAVAASAELQERNALKNVGLAAAMTAALVARGVPDPTAHLAGELGVLAFKRGYAAWSEGDRDATDDLAPYTLTALDELRAARA